MTDIFPAATVVVLRDSEQGLQVLLLRRAQTLAFAGGAWVFPGGRIDKADFCGDVENWMRAALVAAKREAQEEAGLELVTDNLQYISHWTAPPGLNKRFATWFFITVVDRDVDVRVDGSEIDLHRWYCPKQAIEAFNDRLITLMAPTFVTLWELCQCATAQQALLFYSAREVRHFKPKIVKCGDSRCALYAGDAGYESACLDEAGGSRHRLWMIDGQWRYENNL